MYVRFSAIAQALLCILAVWFVENLVKNSRSRHRFILSAIVLMVALLDLGPFTDRPVVAEYDKFSEMREFLNDESVGGVLIPDGSLVPMELSMQILPGAIDAPLVNTYSNFWMTQVYPHAYESRELAAYLTSRKVTHIVAVVDDDGTPFIAGSIQDAIRFVTDLDPAWFIRRGSLVKLSTGQSVGLYEIQDVIRPSSCGGCSLGQVKFSPPPFVESGFDYVRWVTDIRWFASPTSIVEPEIIPDLSSAPVEKFQVDFAVQIYPGAGDSRVTLSSSSESFESELSSGQV